MVYKETTWPPFSLLIRSIARYVPCITPTWRTYQYSILFWLSSSQCLVVCFVGFCLFVGFVGFCLFVSFVVLFSHNVDIQALSPSRGMVYPSVVAEDWNRLWKIKSWKIWICFVLLLLIWIEWRHLQSTVLHHHRELSDLPSLSRCIWSRMKVKIELNWSWAFYQRRRRHNLKCVECACRLSLKRDQIF